MVSDRRLYITADRKRVVEEGDTDGAHLFVGAGSEIDVAEARKYKIRVVRGKVVLPKPKAKRKPKAKAKAKAQKAADEDPGGE